MKKYRVLTITISILVMLIGVVATYLYVLFEPTLQVSQYDSKVKIKTLVLGEYYSAVEELNIYDLESNSTVATFKAKSEKSRMHTITIVAGYNAFEDMYLKDYNIIYPESDNYKFKVNNKYKVIAKWAAKTKEALFELDNNT